MIDRYLQSETPSPRLFTHILTTTNSNANNVIGIETPNRVGANDLGLTKFGIWPSGGSIDGTIQRSTVDSDEAILELC